MKILYISHNTDLRSTTCVLDAAISSMYPDKIQPFMVFPKFGPWMNYLQEKGIPCYMYSFIVPDKRKPVDFFKNLIYWVRLIQRHNIDIVHLNEHDNYPMIRHAVKITGTKVVVGVRFVLDGGYGRWAFRGFYRPKKLLFTSYDQLMRSRKEIPFDFPANDILLLGNGRNLTKFIQTPDNSCAIFDKFKLQKGEFVLGTASTIRPRKRLEDFIEVVYALKLKGLNVRGFIAGGGDFSDPKYFSALKNQIEKLRAQNYIHMLGNIENISDFYRKIDIFISTSELETFGMSVCEAMAFSKPVVAYEGGSVREVLNDQENTVCNGDKNKMVDKIVRLINEPSFFQTCANNNKKRAFQNYNTESLVKKLSDIYCEIVGERKC